MKKSDLIFIVEDDHFYASAVSAYLESMGFENIAIYESGKECLKNIYKRPQLVLLDYNLADTKGMNIMLEIVSFDSNTPVVFISGQVSIQSAIDTLKFGAFDYIQKDNYAFDKLADIISRISEGQQVVVDHQKKKYKKQLLVGTVLLVLIGAITLISF